jgi:hypothetical protein
MHVTNRIRIGAILALTLTTAYIHATLGGLLFMLNGVGYLVLALLVSLSATLRHPVVRRFAWLPRVGLAGYAGITIVGYVVLGPHFLLGWVTKGIEIALIGLVTVDLLTTYRGPKGLLRAAIGSVQFEGKAS